jgi:SAM-dependent methyltransferase
VDDRVFGDGERSPHRNLGGRAVKRAIYGVLEFPWVYRAARTLLSPGADASFARITAELKERFALCPPALDVGCGPASTLPAAGLEPVDVDLSARYAREFSTGGLQSVIESAECLPFRDGEFATVWSIGLLHHLADEAARVAVGEMRRVCAPGGSVVILDPVMCAAGKRIRACFRTRLLGRWRGAGSRPSVRKCS